jgi:hypothetical protein
LKQWTNALHGSAQQTECCVGMDFIDPPVDVVRLGSLLGADRVDMFASALSTTQAILFDDVDGSFAPV